MLRRLILAGLVFPVLVVLLSLPSRESQGVVSQIDGTIVPTTGDLQIELTSHEGDPTTDPSALDAIVDAETFPQIFLPPDYGSGQVVTFTDVQEQAGFENTFGGDGRSNSALSLETRPPSAALAGVEPSRRRAPPRALDHPAPSLRLPLGPGVRERRGRADEPGAVRPRW